MRSPCFSIWRFSACFAALCLLLNGASTALAQFTERHELYDVLMFTTGASVFGHAVSVCDFDGDGLDDISFGTTDQSPRFYRNTGAGFELVSFGISSPSNSIKALLWADIDNDGDQDLFISYEYNSVRLYENTGNMVLVEITPSSGLVMESSFRNAGASFGDYNNDGFLDLYLCKYHSSFQFTGPQYENKLYRNNGDLTFTEVTAEANASVGVNPSFIASWFDYNEDGWQDIFVANDRLFFPNFLLRNNGDGTFTDVSEEAGVSNFMDSMGIGFGDFNNDLLLDFFVPNTQENKNHLYRHQADHHFENIAESAGVESNDLCWSGLWFDFDNNGWLDLHVATEQHTIGQIPYNLFYVNNTDETFTESAAEVGLSNDNRTTYATAQGDWNMDGYPDFVSHNVHPEPSLLWENNGGSNHYLAVTLQGVISNRDAVGTSLYCYADGNAQMRYTACGEAYLAQNSRRQLFGLGEVNTVDSLVIHWLSGQVDRYYDLQADSTYHFIEGGGQNGFISSVSNHFCAGDSLLLVAHGGSNIVWSNGVAATDALWVSAPGVYSYTAESALGLPFTSVTYSVLSTDLSGLSVQTTPPLCAGEASGTVEISGAVVGAELSFFLNDLSVGWAASGLAAGSYELVAASELGCMQTFSFILEDEEPIEPNLDVEPIACFGQFGSAQVDPTGGTGALNVFWSASNAQLSAGEYTVLITDEVGCSVDTTFVLSEPSPLEASATATDVSAEIGGSIVLDISGGTPPYSISWMGPNGFSSASAILFDLIEGVYTALIVDSQGCIASEAAAILPLGSEEKERSEFLVYPNPSSGQIHVACAATEKPYFRLYDVRGRELVLTVIAEDKGLYTIDIQEFESGNYLLVVHSTGTPRLQTRLLQIRK
jgi:hypothetical protein